MRRAAALLAVATTSAIDWAAPGAARATLATLEGYPPPTCTCAATLEGSVDDVVDALLDPGTHHTWVSRLDESVVLAVHLPLLGHARPPVGAEHRRAVRPRAQRLLCVDEPCAQASERASEQAHRGRGGRSAAA